MNEKEIEKDSKWLNKTYCFGFQSNEIGIHRLGAIHVIDSRDPYHVITVFRCGNILSQGKI
jgi:hypothetical protein